ncbi:hypothetical protein BH18ACI5_BH18ACI5_13560 [soil metagenome]
MHKAVYGARDPVSVRGLQASGRAIVTPTVGSAFEQPVEVRLQQPDRYLRLFSTAALLHYRGFNGNQILNSFKKLDPTAAAALSVRPADLELQRNAGSRLLVSLLGVPLAGVPVRVTAVSPGNQGAVLRIEVTGGHQFDLTLDSNSLPTAISYLTRARMPSGADGPVSGAAHTLPAEQEMRMETRLLDRRSVDGVSIPTRLVTQAQGVVFEDLRLEKIEINPIFTDAHFRRAGEER